MSASRIRRRVFPGPPRRLARAAATLTALLLAAATTAAAAATTAAAEPPGVAQDEPAPGSPRMRGSAEVSILELDVRVTGRDGKPTRGLTRDDFEVRLDGRPVPVANFSEYGPPESPALSPDGTGVGASGAGALGPASVRRPRRSLVVFVDRLVLTHGVERRRLSQMFRELVRETLGEGDEGMVVSWNRSLRVVVPFTSDLDALERALDREVEGGARVDEWEEELTQLSRDVSWLRQEGLDAAEEAQERSLAERALATVKGKAAALRAVCSSLGGLEGQKLVFFVSQRFPRFVTIRSGRKPIVLDTKDQLDGVVAAANANGVTLYASYPTSPRLGLVNVVGRKSEGEDFSRPLGSREVAEARYEEAALDILTGETGGRQARGPIDTSRMVPMIREDLQSYYSLGIASLKDGLDRTRSVRVNVRGRSGLRVRSRRALVEKSYGEHARERVLASLLGRVESDFALEVTRGQPVRVSSRRYRTPVEIRVPLGELATLPTQRHSAGALRPPHLPGHGASAPPSPPRGEVASFSVFVASASPDGAFSEVRHRSHRVEIPAEKLEVARRSYVTYEVEVETRTPRCRVSVGVLDEVGKGAAFSRIELGR